MKERELIRLLNQLETPATYKDKQLDALLQSEKHELLPKDLRHLKFTQQGLAVHIKR